MTLMGSLGTLWIDLIVYALLACLLLLPRRFFERLKLRHLIIIILVARLSYYAFKVISGCVLYDYDTTYYYTYGSELFHGNYPQMEYPTGALLLFGALSLPAASVEAFRLIFPLLQMPFTILITVLLYRFGQRYKKAAVAAFFIILYALSPAINWFWFHRYDETVIALILLALYHLDGKRPLLGTFWTAIGTMVKWVPLLLLPAHAIHWLKKRDWRTVWKAAFIGVAVVLVFSLPFLLIDSGKFTHTYKTQMNRTLNGESVYYALEGDAADGVQPYGYPAEAFFTNLSVSIIAIVAMLIWLAYLFFAVDERNKSLYAILTLLLFIITNKIYSTQYIVWILPLLAVGGMMLKLGRNELPLYLGALLLMDVCNFIKTPVTPASWLFFSRFLWALLVGLFVFVLARTIRGRLVLSSHPASRNLK
jgi:uncharacterized membrane protein